jgi:signal transduction histidine kinase
MDERACTRFAPAERCSQELLILQSQILALDPMIRLLLDCFPEPAMVLNRQRQIVQANDKLENFTGKKGKELFGLRPGEALDCLHAGAGCAGCGTSEFCSTCGAVRSILDSQQVGTAQVQECRISLRPSSPVPALDLRVWSSRLEIRGHEFTVFAVRDITDEKRRQVFERTFFHDALNAAGALRGILQIWPSLTGEEATKAGSLARRLSEDLVEELLSGRDLTAAESGSLEVELETFDAAPLLEEICECYRSHRVGLGKEIPPLSVSGETMIRSHRTLLRRVIANLVKNALEASEEGQKVTVGFANPSGPVISVHNETVMPEETRLQVFQRSFSTKGGTGRGVGTYSVKLLTERYLGGIVDFVTLPGLGTTFRVRLP